MDVMSELKETLEIVGFLRNRAVALRVEVDKLREELEKTTIERDELLEKTKGTIDGDCPN